MRLTASLFFAALLLVSCSGTNRIIDTNDGFKEVSGFKLTQTPEANTAIPKEKAWRQRHFNLNLNYYYEEFKNSKPQVYLEVRLVAALGPDELDSVMFFDLDNEKIRLVSKRYQSKPFDRSSSSVSTSTTTAVREKTAENSNQTEKDPGKEVVTTTTQTTESETSNYQLMNREFLIPENLWVSIAHTQNIRLRFYLGREGIDVEPNHAENARLREFFFRADRQRIAGLPPLPEGMKKW